MTIPKWQHIYSNYINKYMLLQYAVVNKKICDREQTDSFTFT